MSVNNVYPCYINVVYSFLLSIYTCRSVGKPCCKLVVCLFLYMYTTQKIKKHIVIISQKQNVLVSYYFIYYLLS